MKLHGRRCRIGRVLGAGLSAVMTLWSCRGSAAPTFPCSRPAFSLVPSVDTLTVGATRQFTVGPELATNHGQIRWTASSPLIATVDQTGLATALSKGSVQIHAIDEGSSSSCPDQWYGTLVVR